MPISRHDSGLKAPKGFSIVELLVVIGIIAVLLAFTLPALSEARARSRQVKCLAQVRQQSVAMFTYVADARDTAFPFTTRHSATWMIRLAPYLGWSGNAQINESTGTNMDNTLNDRSDSTVRVDVKVPVFICPEGRPKTDFRTYNGGYYGINLELTSSRNAASPSSWAARRTLQQIKSNPSRIVLSGEMNKYAEIDLFSTLTGSITSTNQNVGHIDSILNLMFVDGHAEPIRRYQRTDLWAFDGTTAGWY